MALGISRTERRRTWISNVISKLRSIFFNRADRVAIEYTDDIPRG